jgi:tetratricopeptide (TPR) repeat protein
VKGWLGDTARMGWALGYWNARKALFVARGRRGRCPCHNPSDSGRPLETGCEAVITWNRPARFRNVCPLLVAGPKGGWVCSVGPEKVRPFWGRAAGMAAAALALALVTAAGLGYGSMRLIGYRVTLRQVAWPPAWPELHAVRAELFVRKARTYYESGQTREALSALRTAHEIAPEELGVSLPLAEVAEATSPDVADSLYFDMIRRHPERRREIAQVWLHGLVTHGRVREAAELASRQLPLDPADAAAWTNVLVFTARLLGRPEILESAAAQPDVPAEAAAALRFEALVRRTRPGGVPALLLGSPLNTDFPYAIEQRVSLLVEFGRAREALGVLAQARAALSGRDIARLALSAYAALGDRARLKQQVADLLASGSGSLSAKLTLVAEHLIVHPDAEVLAEIIPALGEGRAIAASERRDVWLALLCAAGASGDKDTFHALEAKAAPVLSATGLDGLTGYYFPPVGTVVRGALPPLEIGSMSLAYALMERAAAPNH